MSFEFYVSIQKVKENGFNLKSKPLPLEQITKTNTKKKIKLSILYVLYFLSVSNLKKI